MGISLRKENGASPTAFRWLEKHRGNFVKISSNDFLEVLVSVINEKFPNTQQYIVKAGDDVKDLVMELREEDARFCYSPYELFICSNSYEETIEKFLEQWNAKRSGK